MLKAIKVFFKSIFGNRVEPVIPTTLPAEESPANIGTHQEFHEVMQDTNTFYWDGTDPVEGPPMESEVALEAPKKKKRKPYKKRNKNTNQPKQVDQLGLPKMKANDETPRPKSNKRRGRRPNNTQNGNSTSSTPQKD